MRSEREFVVVLVESQPGIERIHWAIGRDDAGAGWLR
jgi:hypothetical protein